MYICEKCGKQVTEKYGSGRFCSRQCANSRTFSEESRQKKRAAVINTKAYSNGKIVKYFHKTDNIPDGFIPCNFSKVKNYSFEEYQEYLLLKELHIKKVRQDRSFYLSNCRNLIDKHNSEVIEQYEKLLKQKASNKTFNIKNT